MKKVLKGLLALSLTVALFASPALQVTETAIEKIEPTPLQADPGGGGRPTP